MRGRKCSADDELKNQLEIIDNLKDFLDNNPIDKKSLQSLQDDFKLNYTYHSNAIEGNTMSISETMAVLIDGATISGKSLKEHLELINHAEAIDYIINLVNENTKLSEYIIKSIHNLILHSIDRDNAGKYRKVLVSVGGTIPPQPFQLEPLMNNFINTLNQYDNEKKHPILLASYTHLEFVRIHPFIDGNGRTARLIMNLELMKNKLPAISIDTNKRAQYYEAIRDYVLDKNTLKMDLLLANYVIERLELLKEFAVNCHSFLDKDNLENKNTPNKTRKNK